MSDEIRPGVEDDGNIDWDLLYEEDRDDRYDRDCLCDWCKEQDESVETRELCGNDRLCDCCYDEYIVDKTQKWGEV